MRILGVDPGAKGAMALLVAGRLERVVDMPVFLLQRGKSDKAEIDGYRLGDLLRDLAPDVAYVELVGGMDGQSPSASFNFGRAAGAPEYALKAQKVRVERVAPLTWKRALRVNGGKDGAVAAATGHFPHDTAYWAAVRGNGCAEQREGRAEAALIARYGFNIEGGSTSVFA